jgi:hypothetical protein
MAVEVVDLLLRGDENLWMLAEILGQRRRSGLWRADDEERRKAPLRACLRAGAAEQRDLLAAIGG